MLLCLHQGTLKVPLVRKQGDAKCTRKRRAEEEEGVGGGTKRKEIVVLWFMKGWKMEQPCLPAVMTVIVSKWLPAGERSSEFCPGQRWTV